MEKGSVKYLVIDRLEFDPDDMKWNLDTAREYFGNHEDDHVSAAIAYIESDCEFYDDEIELMVALAGGDDWKRMMATAEPTINYSAWEIK